jgi:hypothetical protein
LTDGRKTPRTGGDVLVGVRGHRKEATMTGRINGRQLLGLFVIAGLALSFLLGAL